MNLSAGRELRKKKEVQGADAAQELDWLHSEPLDFDVSVQSDEIVNLFLLDENRE